MLFVYRSNSQKLLLNELCKIIKQPTEYLLQPDSVVFRNHGIRKWLQQQITEINGISTNLNYVFPNQFLIQILKQLFPTEKLLIDSDEWNWKLLDLLLSFSGEKNEFNNYLKTHNPAELYSLAITLSDIFQQYILFNPTVFEKGQVDIPLYQLQEKFWQQIFTKEKYEHISSLNEKLRTKESSFIGRIACTRIFIFGISYFPKIYLSLFDYLSNFIDIYFFQKVSSKDYFGGILSVKEKINKELNLNSEENFEELYYNQGHNLFNAWGLKEKEFQFLLLNYDWDNKICFEEYQSSDNFSLLGKLQNSILEDKADKWEYSNKDNSISINVCHSLRREVEELYNYLLKVIEENPDLSSQDILVKSPKIDLYAPYIQQVFSNSEYPLSYTISYSEHSGLAWYSYFLKLSELPAKNFELDAILELLDCYQIQQKFELEDSDLIELKSIIKKSGIRWGRNLKDIQQQENFEKDFFSWEYGINEIVTSCVLESDKLDLNSQFYTSLGNFFHFFNLIKSYTKEENIYFKEQTIDEWCNSLQTIISNLFKFDLDSDILLFESLITKLKVASVMVNNSNKINYQTIFSYLKFFFTDFVQQNSKKNFLSGSITFCNIQPMRSIPFKVICLLGLDDSSFPRQQNFSELNLLHCLQQLKKLKLKEKINLPNIKVEDFYVFLETILAAEKYLYLSYVGYNIKDNKQQPASLTVTTLLSFLCEKLEIGVVEEAPFFNQHFLYGFDDRYFEDSSNYQSYSKYFYNLAKVEQQKKAKVMINPKNYNLSASVFIEEIVNFFKSPIKYYCKKILNLNALDIQGDSKNYDYYEIEPLKFYHLAQQWLKLKKTGFSNEKIIDKFYLNENFPPPPIGVNEWNKYLELLESWACKILQFKKPQYEVVSFALSNTTYYGGYLLHGNKNIKYEPARFKLKRKVASWIYHLFLCYKLPSLKPETYFFGLSKKEKKLDSWKLKFVENPLDYIQYLLREYQKGIKEPICFDCDLFEKESNCSYEVKYFLNLFQKEENNQQQEEFAQFLPQMESYYEKLVD